MESLLYQLINHVKEAMPSLSMVDEDYGQLEANDDAVVRPEDISADKPQPGLDNNPGKDGHIFNDTHPYFPSDCRHCPFNKGFKNKAIAFFKNEEKHCNNCSKVDSKFIPNTPDPHRDPANNFFKIKNKYKNGGELLIHNLADKDKEDFHTIVNIGQFFAKLGHKVKVMPRYNYKSEMYKDLYGSLIGTKYERKCPDLSVDGNFYEYEGYKWPWKREKVKNMISHGLKQSDRIIIDNSSGCSDRFIRKAILARLHLPGQKINEVWLYEKGNVRLLFKNEKFV